MQAEHGDTEAHRAQLAASVDGVQAAVDELRTCLQTLGALLEQAASTIAVTGDATDIARSLLSTGSIEARVDADDAIRRYQHAMQALRGVVIQRLVVDDGLTLTEVARLLRLSPQMVRRLYRLDRND